MARPLKLLIAEDDLEDASLLVHTLRQAGFDPDYEIVETLLDFKAALKKCPWEILVSDHTMPDFNAIDALRIIKDARIDLPMLIVSGTIDTQTVADTVLAGARHYISKADLEALVPVIEHELARTAEKRRSSPTPGRMGAEKELVDLNALLMKMVRPLRRLAGDAAHLVFLPKEGIAPICADVAQIQQIVISLCANASNATFGKGAILLETGDILVDERFARHHPPLKLGTYVVLSVTDTGVGMDEEALRRLVDPSAGAKPSGGGSGLGLWIVREFVRENDGHILVHSAPGRGTSIKIVLPVAS